MFHFSLFTSLPCHFVLLMVHLPQKKKKEERSTIFSRNVKQKDKALQHPEKGEEKKKKEQILAITTKKRMMSVGTQWALQSILQLGHQQIRSSVASSSALSLMASSHAIRVSAMPRLMQATDGSRVLLLAKRPNGIAGVEIGSGGRVPWVVPASYSAEGGMALKRSKKVCLLAAYLQRRGFETIPVAPFLFSSAARTPLILHANHLIGWKLNRAAPAFPLYAHTLTELQQLGGREVATLQPHDCLVADAFSEWDNWREVLCEPGWDFFSASDDAVQRIVRDGVAAPFVDAKSGVSRMEVS